MVGLMGSSTSPSVNVDAVELFRILSDGDHAKRRLGEHIASLERLHQAQQEHAETLKKQKDAHDKALQTERLAFEKECQRREAEIQKRSEWVAHRHARLKELAETLNPAQTAAA